MEVQIIRHRATRKSAIGVLYVNDFECFTLERRDDMLDQGRHAVSAIDPLMIGDHMIIDSNRKEGISGQIILGLAAHQLALAETAPAYCEFARIVAKARESGERINVEVIDNIDYNEADGEVS